MTDTPPSAGDGWTPDGWNIPPHRPAPQASFVDRAYEAIVRAIDWAQPRWERLQEAHVDGARAASVAPVAVALAVGLATVAFSTLTARETVAVRRLNRYTARFDVAAEYRETAAVKHEGNA